MSCECPGEEEVYGGEVEVPSLTSGRDARESVEPTAGALDFDAQIVLAAIVLMAMGE